MSIETQVTRREVIEEKLLTALEGDAVAVLCSEHDLTMLIEAMKLYQKQRSSLHSLDFQHGLERLRKEAFGL